MVRNPSHWRNIGTELCSWEVRREFHWIAAEFSRVRNVLHSGYDEIHLKPYAREAMNTSKGSPARKTNAFIEGFMSGVGETPRGYFAPALILWRTLRRGLQWWSAETQAIIERQR